ncbi:MAG TPA: DUF6599 family protein [Acidobacteriaceae bacterium]|jgi:hypothetical protein|nr:DUF6599 family protein [Acidobacteriaceae bacterium]
MPRTLAGLPILFASLAFAVPGPAASAPLLPQSFAGWTETGSPSTAPSGADAAVLQEYGLVRFAAANYSAGVNRMAVSAWQFKDATGAFGAFTFYRQPQMHAESLGQEGAAVGDRYLFWTGPTLVDATFAHPVTHEQAALAVLATLLPRASGGASVPPSLPHYLPAAGLNASSVRYAIGPAAYARSGGAVPPADIDFSQDAEVVTAQYGPAGAPATLTLVMYPTPQMAEAHLMAMQSAAQQSHSIGGLAKRSGPLLAMVSGNWPAPKAQQLLDAIRFNDYVTINHPEGYVSESMKLYRLLTGITMLTVTLVCGALLLGLFLGGGRALLRVVRGKPVSSVSEEEFISLHLGN